MRVAEMLFWERDVVKGFESNTNINISFCVHLYGFGVFNIGQLKSW